MKVKFKEFTTTGTLKKVLPYEEAAEFASGIGPSRLINITQQLVYPDAKMIVITVWYWSADPNGS